MSPTNTAKILNCTACSLKSLASPCLASRPSRRPSTLALWARWIFRSEEHTSELQSRGHLVCRLLLEKKTVLGRARTRVANPTAYVRRALETDFYGLALTQRDDPAFRPSRSTPPAPLDVESPPIKPYS